MRILAIGSKYPRRHIGLSALRAQPSPEGGFALIEILVALVIMAIILGGAVLALPNHDERYWRDNLDQLVASLNLAQDESAMSGSPMVVQIDSVGWRFYSPSIIAAMQNPMNSNMSSSNTPAMSTSGLIPDVYKAQPWHKPVEMSPIQMNIGNEEVSQVLQIAIKQDTRQAVVVRNNNGRFSWQR